MSSVHRLLLAGEHDQFTRWAESTSIQGADLTLEKERAAPCAFRACERYQATGGRTALIELGVLPAASAVPSESAEE